MKSTVPLGRSKTKVGRVTALVIAMALMSKPLLVTDSGLAALPIVANAVDSCRFAGLGCETFSGIKSNPTGDNVDDGVRVYREGGHDGVIAFGGGSALAYGAGAVPACDVVV